MEQVQIFIGLTSNKLIIPRQNDRIVWKGNKNGQFSVKGYCSLMEGGPSRKASTNIIWNPYVPTKVSFFAWEARWGKVLTTQQLKKRGYQLARRCPFCREEEEGLDHILIHCPLIWDLWVNLILVLGVSWSCPFAVKDLIHSWGQIPVKKNVKNLWWAAPLTIFWETWKERNRIVFEEEAFSFNRLKCCISSSLLYWATIIPNVDISMVTYLTSGYRSISRS